MSTLPNFCVILTLAFPFFCYFLTSSCNFTTVVPVCYFLPLLMRLSSCLNTLFTFQPMSLTAPLVTTFLKIYVLLFYPTFAFLLFLCMPSVTVSHVQVAKAISIACNEFGSGGHQLGSRSAPVPCTSCRRMKNPLETFVKPRHSRVYSS